MKGSNVCRLEISSICQDTPDQDTVAPKTRLARISPKDAGLKMCLPIFMKFLVNIARMLAKTGK
ncbi:MAG: hypothetical protein UU52_C0019G0014 [Candidatus Levybacteria bacterium GW2011_GWB1_41_21]|nr:MAG: hypothetical protein UU52_C0019G0014 [Candidatus Levybacteria bacterium GW2011_GWB1_41_21]